MSNTLQVGDRKTLLRPTFLYKGIFVLKGSTVEIKKVGVTITVEWFDKEGNPHLLNDIKPEELS